MIAAVLALSILAAAPAPAAPPPDSPPGVAAGTLVDRAAAADVVEQLGDRVPLEAALTRSDGVPSTLGGLLREGLPAVLVFGYRRCPGLCDLAAGGLAAAIRKSGMRVGTDLVVITVGLDPREPAAEAARERERRLQSLGAEAGSPWYFVSATEETVRTLTDATGVRWRYDASTDLYAHPAVFVVLSPDGTISRYLYGIEPPPRDLRLSLVEAAGGRVGTSFDRVILTCFRWDPAKRRYAFFVSSFLRVGGLAVFLGLGALLAVLWRRELLQRGASARAEGRAPGDGDGE